MKAWDAGSSVNVMGGGGTWAPLNRCKNVCYYVGILDTLAISDSSDVMF